MAGIKLRLSVMMFLQYAIWGSWAPFLWPYLTDPNTGLGLSNPQTAFIFGLLWLACILAPFTGGQIADRYIPTQWFLGIAHTIGAILLYFAARSQTLGDMTLYMALYSLLYAPTLALTNSLAFHHIPNEKDFGYVRVFGTIGWIVAAFALFGWRKLGVPAHLADMLMVAAIFSIVQGAYCFTLPHTPPAKDNAADPLAFREAFVLLKDSNFLMFLIIAFVVTTELQFFYGPTAQFLEAAMKIGHDKVPIVMSVAQMAEIVTMWLLLPIALRKYGIRKTLAVGVIAWPLRYLVFAAGPFGPLSVMQPLVIASLTLHGLGFTFFFVVSQIYVDLVAPKDIRASAQSLLTLVTMGLGNWLGTQFTGWIMGVFKAGQAGTPNTTWSWVFLVPCVLTVSCAVAFLLFFKDPESKSQQAVANAPA